MICPGAVRWAELIPATAAGAPQSTAGMSPWSWKQWVHLRRSRWREDQWKPTRYWPTMIQEAYKLLFVSGATVELDGIGSLGDSTELCRFGASETWCYLRSPLRWHLGWPKAPRVHPMQPPLLEAESAAGEKEGKMPQPDHSRGRATNGS